MDGRTDTLCENNDHLFDRGQVSQQPPEVSNSRILNLILGPPLLYLNPMAREEKALLHWPLYNIQSSECMSNKKRGGGGGILNES